MPRRAFFIDRDGTLTRGSDPLDALPGAVDAVRRINAAGWQAIVVTQQPGSDEDRLADIHERFRTELLDKGARLDGIYHCLHNPDTECRCRKPGIALLERARDEMGIDLPSSYFAGAAAADLLAAQAAGMPGLLVRTGRSSTIESELRDLAISPLYVADSLDAAIAWTLDREARK